MEALEHTRQRSNVIEVESRQGVISMEKVPTGKNEPKLSVTH